jgi:uncharacterized membrane protein YdbT with pleckstrin-like domain
VSSYVGRYLLSPDMEQQIFATRRHWAALTSIGATFTAFWLGGFVALGLSGGVGIVAMTAVCFLFFSLCWFGWYIAQWYVEVFIVTNRRVLLVSGLFTRRVAIMPLIKVTDLTFEQTATGQLLGYGSFIIESAGQHQALARIDFLPDPEMHYQQVSSLLFGPKVDVDPEDVAPEDVPRRDDAANAGNQVTEPLPRVPTR